MKLNDLPLTVNSAAFFFEYSELRHYAISLKIAGMISIWNCRISFRFGYSNVSGILVAL